MNVTSLLIRGAAKGFAAINQTAQDPSAQLFGFNHNSHPDPAALVQWEPLSGIPFTFGGKQEVANTTHEGTPYAIMAENTDPGRRSQELFTEGTMIDGVFAPDLKNYSLTFIGSNTTAALEFFTRPCAMSAIGYKMFVCLGVPANSSSPIQGSMTLFGVNIFTTLNGFCGNVTVFLNGSNVIGFVNASCQPTPQPTSTPTTLIPTRFPTLSPTRQPTTSKPTKPAPTEKPTTSKPTTSKPTTPAPTEEPTTLVPTEKPTTPAPTEKPTTLMPTGKPTTSPSTIVVNESVWATTVLPIFFGALLLCLCGLVEYFRRKEKKRERNAGLTSWRQLS
jgi:hypothetical protein